jgi:hypothetical protein
MFDSPAITAALASALIPSESMRLIPERSTTRSAGGRISSLATIRCIAAVTLHSRLPVTWTRCCRQATVGR